MASTGFFNYFKNGGLTVVAEVVFNPSTNSWEMNFKGIQFAGPEGTSLEISASDASKWQIEGVKGGPIKIGGATNVNVVTGEISGANLTIEIPIPGGSIKYKIEPGPLVPHPTDPSAAPIPSSTFQPQITLGPLSVELPKSQPITTDNIFDPEVPGSPLSGGMLGQAYSAIRHRQRQLDAQIDAAENGHYIAARHVPVSRDPLVLDLDGDGLELAGASGAVLFDHNADGIKTGTGWARPDDGFLVRDRNGNGTIDTGRELFGVDTVKSNNTLATDGFDALRDLDSNGDGFITGADAAFGELRVWQDTNQDGISQSGELRTLAELNISSIGVNGTSTGPQGGQVINNNTVALSTTFTQNGQTHTVGAIDLETNNFFTEFPPEVVDEVGNPVVITEQAKALPQMSGSGMVRNMQAAASLDSDFAAALQAFADTTTRDGQRSQLDNLITTWANTSDFPGGIFSGSIPSADLLFSLPAGITVAEYKNLINVLEAFNGSHFYGNALGGPRPTGYAITTVSDPGTGTLVHQYIINPLPQQVALLQQAYNTIKESVYEGLVVQTRLSPYLDGIDVVSGDVGIVFDTTAMVAMLESRKATDERNTLIDLVELHHYAAPTLLASGFDGVPMLRSWVNALAAGSPLRDELLALGVYAGPASNGSVRSDIYLGDASANNFNAGTDDDWLDGGAGNDILHGGAGNDVLNGGTGSDILAGGVYDTWNGNYNGAGSDTYLFGRGDGQDTIYDSDGTTGVIDKIIFKAGVAASDVVISRSGDNLVLTIEGTSDQVTVAGYFTGDGAGGWAIEEIHFTDDPNATWLVPHIKSRALIGSAGNDALTGYATDDVIEGNDGNDSVSGQGGNDTIHGGNGNDTLNGDDGNDLVLGEAGGDSLGGGHGNDTLIGGADGDTLQGGAGDDTLDGGTGNDILAGGVYDTWSGNYDGTGGDTYMFGLGDGQDTIIDSDATAGVIDRIVFKAGILPADVLISRSGESLVLRIQGTGDQITVNGYFNGDGAGGWAIEQIQFADAPATIWTIADVKSKALLGTTGNDTLQGYATSDTINAGDGNDSVTGNDGNDILDGEAGADSLGGGNGDDLLEGGIGADSLNGDNGNDTLHGGADGDTLQGGAGDDTLDGGTGNDILAGAVYDTWNGNYNGAGSDTYLFGRGDGQDTVIDNDTTAGVSTRSSSRPVCFLRISWFHAPVTPSSSKSSAPATKYRSPTISTVMAPAAGLLRRSASPMMRIRSGLWRASRTWRHSWGARAMTP